MDNQKKIEKLEELIVILQAKPKIRKLSLQEAKEKLRRNDPQYDISNTLKSINDKNPKKEVLATFLSDNIFQPMIKKVLVKFLDKI